MKTSVVFVASRWYIWGQFWKIIFRCRPGTQTLQRIAFAECRRTSWRRAGSWSASIADVADVPDNQPRLQDHPLLLMLVIFCGALEVVLDDSWQTIWELELKTNPIKVQLSRRNVRLSLANLELNIECVKERELSDFRLQRCKRGYNGADRRIQDPQQGKNASLWKIKQLFLYCFPKLIFLRRQGSPAVAPRATYLATQTPQKTMWTHPKVALATSSTRRSQHPSTTRTPQCRKGNNWRLFVTWRRREGVSGDRENLELENFLWYVSKSKHRCLCNVPTLSIFVTLDGKRRFSSKYTKEQSVKFSDLLLNLWFWQFHQTPCKSMDPAPPPPLQRVATPSWPGFRFNAKWFAIRAPDILKSSFLF